MKVIDFIILGLFVIEIALRIAADGLKNYFSDPVNAIDFFLVFFGFAIQILDFFVTINKGIGNVRVTKGKGGKRNHKVVGFLMQAEDPGACFLEWAEPEGLSEARIHPPPAELIAAARLLSRWIGGYGGTAYGCGDVVSLTQQVLFILRLVRLYRLHRPPSGSLAIGKKEVFANRVERIVAVLNKALEIEVRRIRLSKR